MEKIASFTIDHTKLNPGLYVSRVDKIGSEYVTTFDMRVMKPNTEPVMDTGAMHTIEHLMATYLRNHDEISDKIVYFGPMGCRTGFYVIFAGKPTPLNIKEYVEGAIDFVLGFEGEIPGVSASECGNYNDHNLDEAKYYAAKYKREVLDDFSADKYNYPV